MSAECHKHGTDLVYPEGSWPIGVCPSCERDELEAELAKEREARERLENALAAIATRQHRGPEDSAAMREIAREALSATRRETVGNQGGEQ